MKHTIQLILGLCLAAIIIVAACKKSSNNATGPTQSLNQLFSGLRTTPQNLSVQAGTDTTLYGADSTILHFYPNSFMDNAGNVITNGAVNIQLIEMYKPGDMICNRTSSTANGQLLKSAGQVDITATMNGKEIFANKYTIGFKQSGSSTEVMSLYYGGNENADSFTTWTVSDNSIPGTVASGTTDSIGFGFGQGYYYFFEGCTKFHTINCDLLYNDTGKNTIVSIVVPDTSFNETNTQIFIIFPTLNDVTMGDSRQGYIASTNTFSIGNDGDEMPVGMNYELVVIANKNGQYYYYETSGITASGMTINAAMAPETQWDIVARVAAL